MITLLSIDYKKKGNLFLQVPLFPPYQFLVFLPYLFLLQVTQMPFYRNSAVLVLVILVDVYPVAQGIHGDAGGMTEMIAILQSAHDDAGEDVAGARELNGDFFVGQEEILFCKMIETYHGMLTLYDA